MTRRALRAVLAAACGRAGWGLRCSSPSRISATTSGGATWKAASTDGAFLSADSGASGWGGAMQGDFSMPLVLCNPETEGILLGLRDGHDVRRE